MEILTKTNRRGYFGIKAQCILFGIPMFSIIREKAMIQ